MGITSQLTPTLALALGASDVTLQELLTAYSAFPGQGERVEPYIIEKVLDRYGNLIEEHQVKREQVISEKTAYLMTDLLQGVVREGTGQKQKNSIGPQGVKREPPTNSKTPGSSVLLRQCSPASGWATTIIPFPLERERPAGVRHVRSGSIL